jgi:hypothetical protein
MDTAAGSLSCRDFTNQRCPDPGKAADRSIKKTRTPGEVNPPRKIPAVTRSGMVLLRYGIGISVFCHVAALIGLMFASAVPFDSRPAEAITVDIVTADEVPSTRAVPPLELAAEAASDASSQQASAPTPQPSPEPQPDPSQPTTPLPSQAAAEPPGNEPVRQSPAMPTQSPPEVPVASGAPLNMANLFGMPVTLPGGSIGPNFDTQAYDLANLTTSDTAAFRDHVKSCASLPRSITPADDLRIVLRLRFRRNGTLMSDPELIEAPGPTVAGFAKGPALRDAVLKALQACQPYAMLPASKYQEWKVLDVPFTPKDLARG